jgi:hypothetical protein
MFKKILLSAAALTALVLGASSAEAGYGYGGYGYHYRPHYSYCHYVRRPVTIRVWDDYSYSYYYKTIYRSYKLC